MPSNTDMFQQIAGSQPGPFSKYLQPTQPGPMDQPMNSPTGWESKGVGAGEIALGFLKGVRQQRVQQFAQKEAVNQAQYEALTNQIDSALQDPKYAESTKSQLAKYKSDMQAQHFQAETKGVKGGAGEFFKNLLINATGGQMQGSKPLDLPQAHADLAVLTNSPESTKAHWRALADNQLSAAVQPGMSAQEVARKAIEISGKLNLQDHLGQDTDKWVQEKTIGYFGAGTPEWYAQGLPRMDQNTQAPPQVAMPSGSQPTQAPPPAEGMPAAAHPYLNMVTPPSQPPPGAQPSADPTQAPPTAGNIRPADTGGSLYASGFTPQHLAALAHAGAQLEAPHPVKWKNPETGAVEHGMGIEVRGGPPGYNGYWDSNTQRKFAVPVVQSSLTNPVHHLSVGKDGYMTYEDPDLGTVYDTIPENPNDPNSKRVPYKKPEGLIGVTEADGSLRYVPKSQAVGAIMASQGISDRRIAALRAMQQIGISATDSRTARQDLINLTSKAAQSKLSTNSKFDGLVDAARKGQISILTSANAGLNRPISQATLDQAKTNSQPLVDEIEKQRTEQLAAIEADASDTRGIVEDAFPELRKVTNPPPGSPTAPRAATPPASPAPQTAKPNPPPASTRKVVKGIGSL